MVNVRVIFLLMVNHALVELKVTKYSTGLIANGVIYDPVEYPYMVTIMGYVDDNNYSHCTGTLLTNVFVLTAAHCTQNQSKDNMRVYHRLLSSNMSSIMSTNTSSYEFRSVKRIYRYPGYVDNNNGIISGDFCLLKLTEPFLNVKRFAVIGGHPNDFTNNTEMNCTIIGFGQLPKNMSDNPYAGIIGYLNTVKVKYGKDACVKVLINHIISNHFTWKEYLCTKPSEHNICKGDSGGPLICNGFQYGVASHIYSINIKNEGLDCGSTDLQARHGFLYFYKEWIFETIKSGSEPKWSPKTANGVRKLYSALAIFALGILINYRNF